MADADAAVPLPPPPPPPPPDDGRYGIYRALVNRPRTAAMVFVSLVVVGGLAIARIPLELIPSNIASQSLNVQIDMRDSNPREVEKLVTAPTEARLAAVSGLTRITSWTNGNRVSINMEFSARENMSIAYAEVRELMERISANYPSDYDRYYVRKRGDRAMPLGFVALTWPDSVQDPGSIIREKVVPLIERVNGVSDVVFFGLTSPTVYILLNEDLVQRHNVDVSDLISRINADNRVVAGGDVTEGGRRFFVRLASKFSSLQELEDFPVNPYLKLRDIGRVAKYDVLEEFTAYYNQSRSVIGIIRGESDANVHAASRRVKRAAAQDFQLDPDTREFGLHWLFSQDELIDNALSALWSSALWGGVLGLLVIWLFFRRAAPTALICLAIPFSLLIAFVVQYFAGRTLNALSLAGFTLVIGLLVDNAIVVVESVASQRGGSQGDRAARGTGQVALAVLLATATTLAVFVPAAIGAGTAEFGQALMHIGFPLSVALVASLVVALAFLPVALARVRDVADGDRPMSVREVRAGIIGRVLLAGMLVAACAWQGMTWGWIALVVGIFVAMDMAAAAAHPGRLTNAIISRFYEPLLETVLRHRIAAIGAMVVITVVTAAGPYPAMENLPGAVAPEPLTQINVTFPPEYAVRDADAWARRALAALVPNRDAFDIKDVFCWVGTGSGQFHIVMKDPSEARMRQADAVKKILEAMPREPGVRVNTGFDFGGSSAQTSEISMVLWGEDAQTIERILEEQAVFQVQSVGGVTSVEIADSNEGRGEEVSVGVNRTLTGAYGVPSQMISALIGYRLRGARLADFADESGTHPLIIQFDRGAIQGVDELRTILVPSSSGAWVPLDAIAEFQFSRAPGGISRIDQQTSRTLRIKVDPDRNAGDVEREVRSRLANVRLPAGYRITTEGYISRQSTEMQNAGLMLGLGLLLMYLIMGALFESFTLPVPILLTVFLAAGGVVWTLWLWGTGIDQVVMFGAILLIGIVVNNAIVLVAQVNALRAEGVPRDEAVMSAARSRFRPIIMTAATTVVGMLPMALGGDRLMGQPVYPLARTVIGGLTGATLVTLVAVPLVYVLTDSFSSTVLRAWSAMSRQLRGGDAGIPTGS